MMDNSRLTFRISIWRPWLLAVTPLALLAALGIALMIAAGQPAAVSGILVGFAGLVMVLLIPIGLAVRASRWDVGPK